MSKGLRRRTIIAVFVLAVSLPSHGAPGELTGIGNPWWSELIATMAEWMSPGGHEAAEKGVWVLPPAPDEPSEPTGPTASPSQTGGETDTHPDLDPHG